MWSYLINTVKSEYDAIRIWPRNNSTSNMTSGRSLAPHSVYEDKDRNLAPRITFHLVDHLKHNLRISRRTTFSDNTITLYGWPSRGGVIVLENVTGPDFDFMKLDALDPPLRRDADQDLEDSFCRDLLHLGATWWDSEQRRDFVHALERQVENALEAVDADETLGPTRREKGWVRVAWPSEPPGALCVLACEKIIMGRNGTEKLRPKHYGVILLARTMDERCTVLQRLGGTMYTSIDEYQGDTFLKAWEDNHQGEKGPLLVEEFINPSTYRGHPDDALHKFDDPKLPSDN